jgi:hypothetical protein
MTDRYEVSAPGGLAVALATVKLWLKIDVGDTSRDPELTLIIADATDMVERYTNRYLSPRTVVGKFDSLGKCDPAFPYDYVWLRRAPIYDAAVVLVQLIGPTSTVNIASQDYRLKPFDDQARLYLIRGLGAPDPFEPYPLRVTFNAGYANEAAIPPTLKQGLLELIAFFDANRGDCGGCGETHGGCNILGIPEAIKAKLAFFRILRVFA